MLHIGGWYDVFLAGTIRNFSGTTAAGHAAQKLIVGPWAHTSHERFLGDLDMGAAAPVAGSGTIADVNRWLDRYLGANPDADTGPAVRYYLMGTNRWNVADTWPPAQAERRQWYLHSGGRANSVHGDGTLDEKPPSTDEADDAFLYNPGRPVPTAGGNTLTSFLRPGPLPQDDIERRDDVLVYSSELLDRDLVIVGPVRVRLAAATDGLDTDWTAKLCDVHPDGRSYVVCDGIIRARFRESFEAEVLLTPGVVYDYDIDLASTAIVIKQGHRVRLQISSSNFPKFDRNSNTGGAIAFERSWRVAVQRVAHSRDHPSFLEVWQLPDGPE
jgi:putative CocE/NonD family hydrolase